MYVELLPDLRNSGKKSSPIRMDGPYIFVQNMDGNIRNV